MKDRDGFPNPMDIERDRDTRHSRSDREPYDASYDRDYERWERDRYDYDPSPQPRGRGRGRGPRLGRMSGGPYAGYSGFGGPGWTAGGFGDPGYNTSGFGNPDYGMSRSGASNRWDTAATHSWERATFEHGPHAGRGPKGYTRSDERIREDVCERLTMHGLCDASDVEIAVQDGEVVLTGTVRDRQQKYVAEEVVESVPGIRTVDNRIRVTRD